MDQPDPPAPHPSSHCESDNLPDDPISDRYVELKQGSTTEGSIGGNVDKSKNYVDNPTKKATQAPVLSTIINPPKQSESRAGKLPKITTVKQTSASEGNKTIQKTKKKVSTGVTEGTKKASGSGKSSRASSAKGDVRSEISLSGSRESSSAVLENLTLQKGSQLLTVPQQPAISRQSSSNEGNPKDRSWSGRHSSSGIVQEVLTTSLSIPFVQAQKEMVSEKSSVMEAELQPETVPIQIEESQLLKVPQKPASLRRGTSKEGNSEVRSRSGSHSSSAVMQQVLTTSSRKPSLQGPTDMDWDGDGAYENIPARAEIELRPENVPIPDEDWTDDQVSTGKTSSIGKAPRSPHRGRTSFDFRTKDVPGMGSLEPKVTQKFMTQMQGTSAGGNFSGNRRDSSAGSPAWGMRELSEKQSDSTVGITIHEELGIRNSQPRISPIEQTHHDQDFNSWGWDEWTKAAAEQKNVEWNSELTWGEEWGAVKSNPQIPKGNSKQNAWGNSDTQSNKNSVEASVYPTSGGFIIDVEDAMESTSPANDEPMGRKSPPHDHTEGNSADEGQNDKIPLAPPVSQTPKGFRFNCGNSDGNYERSLDHEFWKQSKVPDWVNKGEDTTKWINLDNSWKWDMVLKKEREKATQREKELKVLQQTPGQPRSQTVNPPNIEHRIRTMKWQNDPIMKGSKRAQETVIHRERVSRNLPERFSHSSAPQGAKDITRYTLAGPSIPPPKRPRSASNTNMEAHPQFLEFEQRDEPSSPVESRAKGKGRAQDDDQVYEKMDTQEEVSNPAPRDRHSGSNIVVKVPLNLVPRSMISQGTQNIRNEPSSDFESPIPVRNKPTNPISQSGLAEDTATSLPPEPRVPSGGRPPAWRASSFPIPQTKSIPGNINPEAGTNLGGNNCHGNDTAGASCKAKHGQSGEAGQESRQSGGPRGEPVESGKGGGGDGGGGGPNNGDGGSEDEESAAEDYAAESRARQRSGIRKKESTLAKKNTQKEQMKELLGVLPEGSDPMKNIVHKHARLLLGIVGTDLRTLPSPPTSDERDLAVQRGKSQAFNQERPTAPASESTHLHPYQSWIQTQLRTLGMTRFTFDWESSWQHAFNQLMDVLFYRTLVMALHSGEYNNYLWSPEHSTHAIVGSVLNRYFVYLQSERRLIQKNGENALEAKKAKNRAIKTRTRVAERRMKWCDENGYAELAAQFRDPAVCSDTEEVIVNGVTKHFRKQLNWRSQRFGQLVRIIDHEMCVGSRIGKSSRKKNFMVREDGGRIETDARIPDRLSREVYADEWLDTLTKATRDNLKIRNVQIMTTDCKPYSSLSN